MKRLKNFKIGTRNTPLKSAAGKHGFKQIVTSTLASRFHKFPRFVIILAKIPIDHWRQSESSGRLEILLYLLILVGSMWMRLWDLGGRPLHYDELLHAWYSWIYAEGRGFSHTPITHGPFLFNISAFNFTLFGSSDFIARLAPAIFGVILVGMPYFLRNELGRMGALCTSVFLACSPTLLYFSRFIRNDIFFAVWVLSLIVILWKFIEHPRKWLLFLWVILWSLAFTTKETAYITAAVLGFILLVFAFPDIILFLRRMISVSRIGPPGILLIVLISLTLPLWTPAAGLFQDHLNLTLVNPDPLAAVPRADAPTGAPHGAGLFIAIALVTIASIFSVLLGLFWNRRLWPVLALSFCAVWLSLYTTFFSNWEGALTGGWQSLGYWIAQQPVERAGQPWYYYFILLSNYEFLVLIPAAVGFYYLLRRGSRFDRFLVYWVFANLLIYSYAGEKMPWLSVHLILPLALLSGRVVGLALSFSFGDRLGWKQKPAVWFFLLAMIPLFGMTIYISARASYSHASYQSPDEMLVYAQTGQETISILNRIEQVASISERGGTELRILVDEADSMSWQWRWYLRSFPHVSFKVIDDTIIDDLSEIDVLLLSRSTEEEVRERLTGFTRTADLHQLWWFPKTVYEDLTLRDFLNYVSSRTNRAPLVRYFFFREMDTPMYKAEGVLYLANPYILTK